MNSTKPRRKSAIRPLFRAVCQRDDLGTAGRGPDIGHAGQWVDTAIILAVVLINALLGTLQESRAEAALDSLRKMAAPMARVVRDGAAERIPAGGLVPGDIVHIEAGDFVPADLRLLMSASLRVEESTLTGESVPVEKSTDALADPDVPLGDRVNMCFSGSSVTYGRGMGVVVETGMRTQIGRIASGLAAPQDETTPLQRKLAEISRCCRRRSHRGGNIRSGSADRARAITDVHGCIAGGRRRYPEGSWRRSYCAGMQHMTMRIRKLPAVERGRRLLLDKTVPDRNR